VERGLRTSLVEVIEGEEEDDFEDDEEEDSNLDVAIIKSTLD
jgi:hypothetical protein